MLKAEQIPDAVARLADEAYYDTAGDNPTMSEEDIMKHAIAAALSAWPGMKIKPGTDFIPYEWAGTPPELILPLPTEASDGK